ncbi:glycosyltransferase involved in cell wall biosynthesis [Microbacterium testaceum]|uniref:glycosyltransferase n=1 Tax=Microbacterium testaceum TaxID=2033 RepID=UPI00277F1682|nr:glycosyltransferase [Microbacterium testaceum]MDQ1174266.1 glycosyltransferase involved in cell wall biosynthesis [Microbacterium testaceum]
MTLKPRRVVVALPYINAYRVPLLSAVRERLKSAGIEFFVFAASPSGNDIKRADAIHGVGIQLRQRTIRLGRRAVLVRSLPAGWWNADLVVLEHAAKNLESYLILGARRMFKRRTALWGHGATITKPTTSLTRFAQKLMVSLSTDYFAYTEGSALRAISLGARSDRVTVLNNTLDVAPLQAAFRQHPSAEGPVLLYVGGLDESKRIDRLLRVAERLAADVPHFRLIVGGRGDLEGMLLARDEQWLDYRGGMDLAAKARAGAESCGLIITGRVGLAAIDAFAMSLPVITTEWEFHAPEFEYLNEKNSVVVADDEELLFQAAKEYLTDAARQALLKDGARRSLVGKGIDDMAYNFEQGVRYAVAG